MATCDNLSLMEFRSYGTNIIINELAISEIKISSHYELRHKDSITDEIIIDLIKTLDGKSFEPETIDGVFQYFVNDKIELKEKLYKLIWVLEDNKVYVGAVNAYRRD